MPNWVTGSYAIKGKKENVLNFLNEGLKNSGIEAKQTCQEAFDELVKNAKTKETADGFNMEFDADKPKEITLVNNLTLDTFRPMPDTFLMWDTTNHEKELPEQSKEQLDKYGVVGWYDYGVYVLRGTKWNAELNDLKLYEDDGVVTITFHCETAWNLPNLWLHWVKDTFKVNVLLCGSEESNDFNFYGEIDKPEEDFGDFTDGDCPKEEDFYDGDELDEEAYWDALYTYQSEKIEEMFLNFESFVAKYEVDIW